MNFLQTIFTPAVDAETDMLEHVRFLIVNCLLLASMIALSFFAVTNFFIAHQYLIALLDASAVILVMYAFSELRWKRRLTRAALLGTITLFSLLLGFVLVNEGKNFGLIWTVTLPLYAIFVNGRRTGLLFTAAFYLILFYLAYKGIGIWQDGRWESTGFLRLVVASAILTFVVYFVALNLERTYAKLQKLRQHEEEQLQELERLSITDPLTGMYNRRFIDEVFFRQFNAAKRNGNCFALFVLDLDHFKEYNDTYGHHHGDNALILIAEVLQKTMRRSEDYVFRIGGDEFCGILMGRECHGIASVIGKMRASVEAMQIPHEGNPPYGIITASIGACLIENVDTETFDMMYKKADDALYRAKEEGRNRIVFAKHGCNADISTSLIPTAGSLMTPAQASS